MCFSVLGPHILQGIKGQTLFVGFLSILQGKVKKLNKNGRCSSWILAFFLGWFKVPVKCYSIF